MFSCSTNVLKTFLKFVSKVYSSFKRYSLFFVENSFLDRFSKNLASSECYFGVLRLRFSKENVKEFFKPRHLLNEEYTLDTNFREV